MLNIAIVDDNQDDRTRLSTYVSEYLNSIGEKFTLSLYERGLNFLDDFKKLFNVVFLDIEMPVMNGLEVSKKLRELDANVSIIFVTNFGSLAINGYDVQALDFLVKPVKSLDVKECLKKVMANQKSEDGNKKIVVRIKHGYKALMASEIVYIEVRKHDLFFHCLNETCNSRGVLKDLENELNGLSFVKCSNCYLINLHYVDSLVGDQVLLPHQSLPISRAKKQEFKERFLKSIS